MPYLGRAPAAIGTIANVIEGDLKVKGTISGESINNKFAFDTAADLNDHFLIEDGGTDGSGTNAGDNMLLEDTTQGVAESVELSAITDRAGTSGQVLQSQGAGSTPAFATAAAGGLVLQVVEMEIDQANGTSSIPHDGTVPVSSEGTEIGSQTITLASTSSRVQILSALTGGDKTSVAQDNMVFALFRGTTCIGSQVFDGNTPGGTSGKSGGIPFNVIDSPSSTDELTYSMRVGILTASGTSWYVAQSRYQNAEGDMGGSVEDGVTLTELSS